MCKKNNNNKKENHEGVSLLSLHDWQPCFSCESGARDATETRRLGDVERNAACAACKACQS